MHNEEEKHGNSNTNLKRLMSLLESYKKNALKNINTFKENAKGSIEGVRSNARENWREVSEKLTKEKLLEVSQAMLDEAIESIKNNKDGILAALLIVPCLAGIIADISLLNYEVEPYLEQIKYILITIIGLISLALGAGGYAFAKKGYENLEEKDQK